MTRSKANAEVWDSISLDMMTIEVEGKIVYINTAGAKMLGATTPEQLIGQPMLEFVHPDYREIATERVRQMTTDGLVVCPSEEKWLRLDGTAIDVEVAALPVFYQGKFAVQLIARESGGGKSYRPAHNWRCPSRTWRKRRE